MRASDTVDSWFITMGQFTGTDPDNNKSYDEPDIRVSESDDGSETAATIVGEATDLNCWLWHRPTLKDVERSGDARSSERFRDHHRPWDRLSTASPNAKRHDVSVAEQADNTDCTVVVLVPHRDSRAMLWCAPSPTRPESFAQSADGGRQTRAKHW